MGAVHSFIRHNHGPFYAILFLKPVQIFFQGIGIAHISPEYVHADRHPVPIHEQSHLYNGRQPVFFGNTFLSQSRAVYQVS